ncbi:MAG TPA: hypothetical protein VGL06_13060 [Pseudonocardiaceae bacterium]
MRMPDFDQLAADLIVADDHPEIVSVRLTAPPDNARYHNRLIIVCADGSSFYVMVRQVDGPGIPRHQAYELPKEAVSA